MTNPHQTEQTRASDGPVMARILGYAGALPFLGCVFAGGLGLAVTGVDPSRLLIGYAAVILSFLGGLHWGRVAASGTPDHSAGPWLIWSVIPSVIGWAALFLPVQLAVVILVVCFLAALMIDLKLIRDQHWSAWMRGLRLHLTMFAVASLLSMYFWA